MQFSHLTIYWICVLLTICRCGCLLKEEEEKKDAPYCLVGRVCVLPGSAAMGECAEQLFTSQGATHWALHLSLDPCVPRGWPPPHIAWFQDRPVLRWIAECWDQTECVVAMETDRGRITRVGVVLEVGLGAQDGGVTPQACPLTLTSHTGVVGGVGGEGREEWHCWDEGRRSGTVSQGDGGEVATLLWTLPPPILRHLHPHTASRGQVLSVRRKKRNSLGDNMEFLGASSSQNEIQQRPSSEVKDIIFSDFGDSSDVFTGELTPDEEMWNADLPESMDTVMIFPDDLLDTLSITDVENSQGRKTGSGGSRGQLGKKRVLPEVKELPEFSPTNNLLPMKTMEKGMAEASSQPAAESGEEAVRGKDMMSSLEQNIESRLHNSLSSLLQDRNNREKEELTLVASLALENKVNHALASMEKEPNAALTSPSGASLASKSGEPSVGLMYVKEQTVIDQQRPAVSSDGAGGDGSQQRLPAPVLAHLIQEYKRTQQHNHQSEPDKGKEPTIQSEPDKEDQKKPSGPAAPTKNTVGKSLPPPDLTIDSIDKPRVTSPPPHATPKKHSSTTTTPKPGTNASLSGRSSSTTNTTTNPQQLHSTVKSPFGQLFSNHSTNTTTPTPTNNTPTHSTLASLSSSSLPVFSSGRSNSSTSQPNNTTLGDSTVSDEDQPVTAFLNASVLNSDAAMLHPNLSQEEGMPPRMLEDVPTPPPFSASDEEALRKKVLEAESLFQTSFEQLKRKIGSVLHLGLSPARIKMLDKVEPVIRQWGHSTAWSMVKQVCKDALMRMQMHGLGWLAWSVWSQCTVSCGTLGYQVRHRECRSQQDCQGSNYDLKPCHSQPLCVGSAVWLDWSSWGRCSISCGDGGVQFRMRSCLIDDPTVVCQGSSTEFINCKTQPTCRRKDKSQNKKKKKKKRKKTQRQKDQSRNKTRKKRPPLKKKSRSRNKTKRKHPTSRRHRKKKNRKRHHARPLTPPPPTPTPTPGRSRKLPKRSHGGQRWSRRHSHGGRLAVQGPRRQRGSDELPANVMDSAKVLDSVMDDLLQEQGVDDKVDREVRRKTQMTHLAPLHAILEEEAVEPLQVTQTPWIREGGLKKEVATQEVATQEVATQELATQYVDTQDVDTQDVSWSIWGMWSECTVSCDKGAHYRQRQCIRRKEDTFDGERVKTSLCPGKRKDKKSCRLFPCPISVAIPRFLAQLNEGQVGRLSCQNHQLKGKIRFRYWITPTGETVTNSSADGKYEIHNDTLTIQQADRTDLGRYLCVLVGSNQAFMPGMARPPGAPGSSVGNATGEKKDEEEEHNMCIENPCANDGTCEEVMDIWSHTHGYPLHYRCLCPIGFFGKHCEQKSLVHKYKPNLKVMGFVLVSLIIALIFTSIYLFAYYCCGGKMEKADFRPIMTRRRSEDEWRKMKSFDKKARASKKNSKFRLKMKAKIRKLYMHGNEERALRALGRLRRALRLKFKRFKV